MEDDMKKITRSLMALMLVVCMMFSLTGCGKDSADKDYIATLAKATEFTKGSSTARTTVKFDDGKISELTSGALDIDSIAIIVSAQAGKSNENDAQVTLSVNLGGDDLKLATITSINGDFYFDLSELKNSLLNCGISYASAIASFLPNDNTVVKISSDELKQYTEEAAEALEAQGATTEETDPEALLAQQKDYNSVVSAFVDTLLPLFESSFESVEPAVFSKEGNANAITISSDNYEALARSIYSMLTSADFTTKLDEFSTSVSSKGVSEDLTSEISKAVASVKEDISKLDSTKFEEELTKLKEDLQKDNVTFNFKSTDEIKGKKAGSREFNLTASASVTANEIGTIVIDYTASAKEGDTADFTAPANAVSVDDFVKSVQESLGALYNTNSQ